MVFYVFGAETVTMNAWWLSAAIAAGYVSVVAPGAWQRVPRCWSMMCAASADSPVIAMDGV